MNVSLTPELERFVREKVATGLYNNASEVVREALRAFHGREQAAATSAPPKRQDVIDAIRGIEGGLRAAGIRHLDLFGSVARGDAKAGSDVDVLIEARSGTRIGLLEQAGLQEALAKAIVHKVDLVQRQDLRKELRARALRDAIRVF